MSEMRPEQKFLMPKQEDYRGMMPKMDERGRYTVERKIILLSKENLETLRAYKAIVELKSGWSAEIEITLTGFSHDSAKALMNALIPLPKEEIKEIEKNV